MKLPLAYYGNPILRQKGTQIPAITEEIRQLVADMIETMIAYNGVGIAAPQIGHSLSLFLAYFSEDNQDETSVIDKEKIRVFINPKVINHSQERTCYSEGCLSIPKVSADVERPLHVTITAMDLNGNEFTEEFHDFDAHIVLHENDHLNGVLFIDRLPAKERRAIEPQLRQIKKKYGFHK
ncbi:MAG: peptide deformylase [Parachlamydiaceae bacterium]